jgi:Domain of unknown function (DUF5916)
MKLFKKLPKWVAALLLGSGAISAFAQAEIKSPNAQSEPSVTTANSSVTTAARPIKAMAIPAGQSIVFDGTLNSLVWQLAPVFSEFTQKDPEPLKPARYKTEVRVLYDSEALWVGVQAYDPKPSEIVSPQARFDRVFRFMDFIALYIDPAGKKNSAQFFRVSAIGATADGLHTAADDNEDFSPDYDFEAKGQKNEQGFSVVYRVPYSSLRYDPNSTLPWRIMVARRTPRNELFLDVSVPLARETPNFINNMQVLEGFVPPKSKSFFWLRPTLTSVQTNDISPENNSSNKTKMSVDFKWSPKTELVIDGTLNPDFTQLEIDQIQLTRNARFAFYKQEKRPLFLESRDLISSLGDVIYTRSITDPQWALRASWRSDQLQGTTIATHDRGGGLVILPGAFGSNYAPQPAHTTLIGRAQFNGYGFIALQRQYENDRGSNSVIALDRNWELNTEWRSRMQAAMSSTSALPNSDGELSNQARQQGFSIDARFIRSTAQLDQFFGFNWIDSKFRNDTGFVNQSGIQNISFENTFKRQKIEVPVLGLANDLNTSVNGYASRSADTGKLINANMNVNMYAQWPGKFQSSMRIVPLSLVRRDENSNLMREHIINFWGNYNPGGVVEDIWGWVDIGRLADYSANIARPGVAAGLGGSFKPNNRIDLSPTFNVRLFKGDNGVVQREHSFNLISIFHIRPNHFVRLIHQQSGFGRQAEVLYNTEADRFKSLSQSLTYVWRASASNAFYLGATRSVAGVSDPKNKTNEFYVKWQQQLF